MKLTQDVPKYVMVAGERAELRGLNLVGLTRCGFSTAEVYHLLNLVGFNCIFINTKQFFLGNVSDQKPENSL